LNIPKLKEIDLNFNVSAVCKFTYGFASCGQSSHV
jgi:hypothetical protein